MLQSDRSRIITASAIITAFILFCGQAGAANWDVFSNGNDVTDIVSHGNYIWCATTGGVVCWDTRDMSYRKYTTLDGLPTNGINCIDVTPGGTVWAGTDHGAARYEDGRWTVFTQSEGLFAEVINNVAAGSDGVVWFSSHDGVISRYENGMWSTLTWPEDLPLKWIDDLEVAPNGDIWFGMHDLYRYNGESYEYMVAGLDYDQIREFEIGPGGDVRLSGSRHMYHYDGETWTKYPQEENPRDIRFSQFTFDTDGTCWFSQDDTLWKFDEGFVTVAELPVGNASSISVGTDGTIWVGCRVSSYGVNGAVVRVNRAGETTVNRTWEFMPDWLWYASEGPGDSVLLSGRTGVFTYTSDGVNPFYVSVSDSYKFLIDASCTAYESEGIVWCGLDNTLLSYNVQSDSLSYVSFRDYNWGGCPDNMILDHNGNLWFSTWTPAMTTDVGHGVVQWYEDESTVYSMEDGLFGNWVQDIIVAPDGNIWAAGKVSSGHSFYKTAHTAAPAGGGVSMFDGSQWTSWYPDDGIANYDVTSLGAESDGTIWAGTAEGLSRFDGIAWESFFVSDGLPDNHITAIAADSRDVVWIGTVNGAASFDGSVWTRYSTVDGLSDGEVTDIFVDSNDDVLFLSRHGFSVLHRNDVAVERHRGHPAGISITGAYPNPFNPFTVIQFSFPADEKADLSVYNIAGQRISTLASREFTAGIHRVAWDGTDNEGRMLSSGVYFVRLEAGGQFVSRKVTLLR